MPPEAHKPGEEQVLEWVRSAIERFEAPLTLYARHVLGGDVERARDVVQEVYLRLIAQDPSKIGPRLPEWLYTVCRNLAIDVRRKERRMGLLSDADAYSAASDGPEPSARVQQDDAVSHILRRLKELPWNQQECIRLKFQGGLSYKQISSVTNLTVTNVGFLIHTGLKTLRQRLGVEEKRTE
jgi:RNA polymerase sigma factor (sigma-70 family)